MAMVHVQQSSSPSILTVLHNFFFIAFSSRKKMEKKIWLLKQACAYFIFLYIYFLSYGFKIH